MDWGNQMFSLVVDMSLGLKRPLWLLLLVFTISAKQEKASEAAVDVLRSFSSSGRGI